MRDNRSFFQRLTGAVKIQEPSEEESLVDINEEENKETLDWSSDTEEEGQLSIDVYQTPTTIIIKSMVAGVKPEDLDVSITRDMVTIRGRREIERTVTDDNYFHQELYWGSFSRTIMLPAEVDVEEADAIEKHGLLILTLPKLDKHKQTKLKIKG